MQSDFSWFNFVSTSVYLVCSSGSHLERFSFPSFTFISSTVNRSPSLHGSLVLENVRNQNESVETENGSWAKMHVQDHNLRRKSTGFAWNTSADSFIRVGHKGEVKIDEKFSCLSFSSFSAPLFFCYCFMERLIFSKLFCKAVLCLAPSKSWK